MVSISILKYLLLKSGLLTKKLTIKLNIELLWMKAMWLCVLYDLSDIIMFRTNKT